MTLKLALSTATALGLLMGSAVADNNTAIVVQKGNDNNALVTQQSSGNGNKVGDVGPYPRKAEQDGDNNSLTVNQTGNINLIGLGVDGNLIQKGDRNVAAITQTNNGQYTGNSVLTVRQTSHADSTATANELNIKQGESGGHQRHLVSTIKQDSSASATTDSANKNSVTIVQDYVGNGTYVNPSNGYTYDNSGFYTSNAIDTVEQTGSGNTLSITQLSEEVSGDSRRNNVGTVSQIGSHHTATVEQTGDRNSLLRLLQKDGGTNTATVKLDGNRNGTGTGASAFYAPNTLHTWTQQGFASGSRAAAVGITQAAVEQIGSTNALDYSATGDDNLFALKQDGDGNQILATVSSSDNQLAILQDGNGNLSNVVQSGGDGNDVGISSVGNYNTADVSQSGASNQNGVSQLGNSNVASISVTGDFNNSNGFTLPPASGLGLTAGLTEQIGNFNQVTLTVSGNFNVFASRQNGIGTSLADGNKITATQQGGNSNEAAVVQTGISNVASLVQNGSNNSLAVSQ